MSSRFDLRHFIGHFFQRYSLAVMTAIMVAVFIAARLINRFVASVPEVHRVTESLLGRLRIREPLFAVTLLFVVVFDRSMPGIVKVMFVCAGNSARSQMAEGCAWHYGHGRVEAHSAGMEPSQLNPYAVRVMQEKGIDIAGQHSKAFDWDLARQMDIVATVCGHANESCPVLPPEVKRLHWTLEDPAAVKGTDAEILATFRRIREQVESRVAELLATIS